MTEVQSFKPGDVVRVKDHEGFQPAFAKKIASRDAVVQWVGPTPIGMHHNRMCVEFQKRNGRGVVFQKVMWIRDFVLKEAA